MKIAGLQKVTVIDYPGKIACTLFLYGCTFKCGFCHNPELVIQDYKEEYSSEEILDFLKKRKKYLEGVCITGGEPMLSLEKEFVKKIKRLGYTVKIDTNGSFPEKLDEFILEGLVDYVAMDIKSSKEHYSEVAGKVVDIEKIEKSIKLISKLRAYEFRTTIIPRFHDEKEFESMMEWVSQITGKKLQRFAIQGFKNNGKFIDLKFMNELPPTDEHLANLKKIAEESFDEVLIKN
ncbi:MAG: anaerobic ribonucleoside-triphosphate reductase activating protein [Nanoarchaeota archaeon]|nr:anaerobic ribonucleoside-triphosphate reductase activating protein [Nanoarchaeota archaeon]